MTGFGLRVDPPAQDSGGYVGPNRPTVGYRWQAIVREVQRKRHPIRVRIAQCLRRLVVWIEP